MAAEAPGRCVSCRHWEPDQASWPVANAIKDPRRALGGRGRCAILSFSGWGLGDLDPAAAALPVGWGDDTDVMTRPDFGCLAWEARAGAGPIFWPAVQGHESTEAERAAWLRGFYLGANYGEGYADGERAAWASEPEPEPSRALRATPYDSGFVAGYSSARASVTPEADGEASENEDAGDGR